MRPGQGGQWRQAGATGRDDTIRDRNRRLAVGPLPALLIGMACVSVIQTNTIRMCGDH
jgi:hypothetical protein